MTPRAPSKRPPFGWLSIWGAHHDHWRVGAGQGQLAELVANCVDGLFKTVFRKPAAEPVARHSIFLESVRRVIDPSWPPPKEETASISDWSLSALIGAGEEETSGMYDFHFGLTELI